MNSPTLIQPAVPKGIRTIVGVVSVIGIVSLTVTAILGFEEPNTLMVLVAGAMALGVPAAVLAHLSVTSTLTSNEKRIWLKEFGSAQVWSALSEYLSSTNLSESAWRRVRAAQARRDSE